MTAPTETHRPMLWTQKEAAAEIGVSPSYLRASTCPKTFLPSLKRGGRSMVRYVPEEVEAWWRKFHSDRGWSA